MKSKKKATTKTKVKAKAKATRKKAPAKSGGKSKSGGGSQTGKPLAEWHLLLYVAGMTQKSSSALMNLKAICDQHLEGKYVIEVIDLLEKPQLAKGDQILAIPTLVRKLPSPIKKLIGDLSNSERVLVGLNLKAIGF